MNAAHERLKQSKRSFFCFKDNPILVFNMKSRKLAVCDLTGLFMDEAEQIAKALRLGKKYRKAVRSGKINFRDIKNYIGLLSFRPLKWISSLLKKSRPFAGAVETVELLRRSGYEVFVITDDPLLSIEQNKRIIKEKLGVQQIFPTAHLHTDGNFISGISNMRPKQKILQALLKKFRPRSLIGIVQGENDIALAKAIRREKGFVLGVSDSHSHKLESICNAHIKKVSEAPHVLKNL